MATATRRRSSAEIYEILMTPAIIAAGSLPLPGNPPVDKTRIALDVIALGPQVLNVDYMINVSNTLLWNAMGLQTVLSIGDRIRLVYYN